MSRSFAVVGVVVLAVALVGCAGRQTPTFNAKYYPNCYDPIDKLCKDQSHSQEIKGAVVGGVVGALGGALVGGLATGKPQGIIAGAAAGAAAGGLTGFFSAKLSKINDQNQRLEEYQKILGERSQGWDLERASVERAYQCYGEQIDLLKKGYQAKQISREALVERMNEIKSGIEFINTYWADAESRMNSTIADSDKWLAEEDRAIEKQPVKNSNTTRTLQNAQRRKRTWTDENKKKNERTNLVKKETNDKLVAGLDFLEEVKTRAMNKTSVLVAGL